MAIYTGYAIRLYTDAMGAAVMIGGITKQSIMTGSECRSEPTAGSHFARHQSIYAQKPVASFSTTSIKQVLDNVGILGLKIAATSNPGLEFYEVQLDSDGRPLSGSNHRKIAIAKGLLVPRRLTCEHQQDASIDCDVLTIYDGTNNPLVYTESVSLPTGLDDPDRWTMGAMVFGAVTLADKLSVAIDFGNGAEQIGVNSDHWPTHLALQQVLPTIDVRGLNVSQFAAAGVPLIGLAGTQANSSFRLRHRTEELASFVASGTATHMLFNFDGVIYFDEVASFDRNARGETALKIHCKYDGTNDPITFDTTATLS